MTYLGVKYRAVPLGKNVPSDLRTDELKKWCTEYYNSGFTPEYEGGSAGNLSYRYKGNQFMITGSGITTKSRILDNSIALVDSCNLEKEIVYYHGARKPSSETMLHYVVYMNRPEINAVFHGHSEKILAKADELGLVQTTKEEKEGTKELANAVLEVLGQENFIVLKNHGFVSIGKTMQEAGEQAVKVQEKALEG
ncbi:MAG: class II aldolase/adducin family protein [Candidatus Altiarchaeota archaeon]|nr:class II aldolase/adducin family protein [Candidatus Altiarchaeota archaeon]